MSHPTTPPPVRGRHRPEYVARMTPKPTVERIAAALALSTGRAR